MCKPDRHLEGLSRYGGFSNSQEMCSILAEITHEPVSVVDGVLWRLAEKGVIKQFEIMELTKDL